MRDTIRAFLRADHLNVRQQDMTGEIVKFLVLLGFGTLLGYLAIRGVRVGSLPIKGGFSIRRDSSALIFNLTIASYLGLALFALLGAAKALIGIVAK